MSSGRPHPRTATTAAEFLDALHELRRWAGQPSLRTLTKLAGKAILDGRHQVNRLPVSTLSDNLAGKRLPNPPSQSFVRAYVEACMRARAYDEQDIPAVVEQWDRALAALSGGVRRPARRPALRRLALVGALALLAIVVVAPSRLATTTVDAVAPPAPHVVEKAPPPLLTQPANPVHARTPARSEAQSARRQAPTRRVATPPKAQPAAKQPDYAEQNQAFSEKLGAGITQQQQAYDPANWNP